jgi:hemolysin activation/secretion protein
MSWLGQIQRVQILSPNNLLIVQLDSQLTPDPLLSSQQFVIGGGQSLRGYRQNARSGDNGFRFSIEDRITLARNPSGASIFQLSPFLDVGAVWNNGRSSPEQSFLVGAGLGLLWEPIPNLNVRVDYAVPLIDLKDRGENAQDQGIYFGVNYRL